jgi:glycosyltransferase involved in cell wall biosynthesis
MFSVIIPLYNKQQWIAACLDSVLNQRFQSFEVIIVDDGSTDKSLEVLEPFRTDPRIRIIQQKNQGVSAARNTGISHARYDYIAFLDADDLWHPQYLECNAQVISEHPQAVIYASRYINKESETKAVWEHVQTPRSEKIEHYFESAHIDLIFWTSATVVQKKVLANVGLFDTSLKAGEDLDLWFRLIMDGEGIRINHVLAFYRLTEISRHNPFKLPPIEYHIVSRMLDDNWYMLSRFDKVPHLRSFVYTFTLNYLFPYYFTTSQFREAYTIYRKIPLTYRLRKVRHWLYLLPRAWGSKLFRYFFFKRNRNIVITD